MSVPPANAPDTRVRRKEGRGYAWALGLSAALYAATLALVGFGFLTIPGADPVRQGGWLVAIALLTITPAFIVVALLSCGVVAILRRAGARHLPGVVQALPAVAAVAGLIFLLMRWLFTPVE